MNTLDRKFNPLNEDELRALAPSIFTNHAAERTSERYSYTSTMNIIEDLAKFGWVPVRAIERRVKKSFNIGFQKHIIQFRHPNHFILDSNGLVESYPEICLVNSHDGLTAFQFSLSLYRLACSNGLFFQSDDLGSNRIIHKGYNFKELESTIKKTLKTIPFLLDRIDQLKKFQMNEDQVCKYISQAVLLREKYAQGISIKVDPKEFNIIQREEDKENNLWIVYNRVQERLLKGGFKNLDNNRRLKQVQFLDKILWINRDLWQLTSEWLDSKETGELTLVNQVIKAVQDGRSITSVYTKLGYSKSKYYSLLSNKDKEKINLAKLK